MKTAPSLIALLACLAACGPERPPAPKSPTAPVGDQPPVPAPRTDLPGVGLVQALYAPSVMPFPDKPAKDPFFTLDLAKAMKRDSHPGEVGAIDFDYRYGAQDVQLSNLRITAINTLDGERVVARFENAEKPFEVDYDLVLTRDGWRIADVSAPAQQGDEAWSLRAMLKLPSPDSAPPRKP
ncbi:MAG TPA: hypothetical protein VG960_04755 [Caulobacteraceae bacterium]|nr:hypothetical protein [Caulobacteraceae bacterium]